MNRARWLTGKWRRAARLGFTAVKIILFFMLFIVVLAPEWPAFQQEAHRLESLVGLRQFDFLRWGVNAMVTKVAEQAGNGHHFLAPSSRQDVVISYLNWVSRAQGLQGAINTIYVEAVAADPNPDAGSRELQEELAQARLEMKRLQPLAEAVLQEQVALVLAEQGFGVASSVWPPVSMHMTPLPQVLIVSPREEIRQIYSLPLAPGLTVPEQEQLERRIFEELDRSALVVPIGGLGFYPSMIIETGNISFLADTVAHEWAHHWLSFYPLGIRYFASPQLRTVNETVASIVGTEVGAEVVRRFYPQFAPPPQLEAPLDSPVPEPDILPEDAPRAFDFWAEMAETRIVVDRLLAAGEVEEAESYMEERRQLFVAQGYPIRVLNQAYFAFYGAYADTPGASGADPVGPAVLALRQQSDSLREFMATVARVTSFEELLEMAAQ